MVVVVGEGSYSKPFRGGYGYFLEPHISKKWGARCAALKQIIFFKKGGKWDL